MQEATEPVIEKTEKQIRAEIKQQHPEAVFATLPKVGLIALGGASYDDYVAYLDSLNSNSESVIKSKLQLVIDGLIYPTDPVSIRAIRKFLDVKMSRIAPLQEAVEGCSRGIGEVKDLDLSPEKRAELGSKYEFGFDGISIDSGNIILAATEIAAPIVRIVLDEAQRLRQDMGKKTVAAILASVVEPDRETVEVILQQRPGLIAPLSLKMFELADDSSVEISKN